jgi:glycolate oxidase FAD binding subunit
VAEALQRASSARRALVIRGAGTKMDWGRPAAAIDTFLDMRRLNRVLAHRHGDLTATVEAGATLREVNEMLARHGQWLPLDPPFADRATIGGILATNDSGPLRHRFGTPRDLIIGVTLATTDGVVSKAGGQVVKNVAGYDLSKLVTGSFGSLAAIVSATFKLSPLPAASKTIVVQVPDADALAALVREVMGSQLEPIAFEVATPRPARPSTVLLRFASLPVVVDAQIEQALALACFKGTGAPKRDQRDGGGSPSILDGDAERAWWRERAARIWSGPGAIVRASWLPASIVNVLDDIERTGAVAELTGRAAVGAGLIRIDGDEALQAHAIDQLRQSTHVGNIVIVRGSPALKALVDVWGPLGDRGRLLASLKKAFDPNGVLNAGRGPL